MSAASRASSSPEMFQTGVWCEGDECIEQWPEGPIPAGWTVVVVEDRLVPCCATCTAWYADEAAASGEEQS